MTGEKSEKGGELEWRRKISNPMRKETRGKKKKRKGEDEGWQIIVEEEEERREGRGERGRRREGSIVWRRRALVLICGEQSGWGVGY